MGCGSSKLRPVSKPKKGESTWRWLGGEELEPLFAFTTVVDVCWLSKFGKGELMPERKGVVPAWQELAVEAAVELSELRKSATDYGLPIGVLSYGWAAKAHPDPTGEQLQLLLPLLEEIAKMCNQHQLGTSSSYSPNFQRSAPTWGIVWDFMALPQRGYTTGYSAAKDDRTPEQLKRFKSGLGSINVWYGAKNTYTFVLNTPMPLGAENNALHAQRGWCIFERCLSSIIKHPWCYMELSQLSGECRESKPWLQPGGWSWFSMHCTVSDRCPPMSPDKFEAMLVDGVAAEKATPGTGVKFTSGKDLTDVVIPQYRKGFLRLMAEAGPILSFPECKWGDEEIGQLAAALSYAHANGADLNIDQLQLYSNPFGDVGFASLCDAISLRALPKLIGISLVGTTVSDQGLLAFAKIIESGALPNFTTLGFPTRKYGEAEKAVRQAALTYARGSIMP